MIQLAFFNFCLVKHNTLTLKDRHIKYTSHKYFQKGCVYAERGRLKLPVNLLTDVCQRLCNNFVNTNAPYGITLQRIVLIHIELSLLQQIVL